MNPRLRPHPVVVVPATTRIGADRPGTSRGVPGLTLLRCVKLPQSVLLRYRARHFARLHSFLNNNSAAMRPYYRRRDMLGAFLRMALLRANAAEIAVDDKEISSIALTQDEETGRTRIAVRKRSKKDQHGTAA